jgi:hypothetical protein
MQNKVYNIKGINVVVVEDGSGYQSQSCEFCCFLNYISCPVNEKTHKGLDCLDGDYHYEDAPAETSPSNTHAISENEIYHLTHGENQVVSIGDNSFDIQCLHNILVLFHFDHCCGEYIYVRSFNKTEKGVAACVAAIEYQVKSFKE